MQNFFCHGLALCRFEADYDVSGSVAVSVTFDNDIRIRQTCGNSTCSVYRIAGAFMPTTYIGERESVAAHIDLRALALLASSFNASAETRAEQ
jgi:hypothetical protein